MKRAVPGSCKDVGIAFFLLLNRACHMIKSSKGAIRFSSCRSIKKCPKELSALWGIWLMTIIQFSLLVTLSNLPHAKDCFEGE
jgi:hypothetical protein